MREPLFSGRRIREPKLIQQDYLVLSKLSNLLRHNANKLFRNKKDLLILDVGCGEKPYYPFFTNYSSIYVGIDLNKTKFVDVICCAQYLPFKDHTFEIVICTQVLEHVEAPNIVIENIFNKLKKEGFLFLSTHGIWMVHPHPFDFWRWTDLGLKKLLTNFSTVEVHDCGGSVSSIIQLFNLFIPTERMKRLSFLGRLLFVFLNKTGEVLDSKYGQRGPNLIVNYLAIAKK